MVGATAHPTAEWIANHLTEACGWEQIPRYLIRDRDGAYGEIFLRRVRSIGIRDPDVSSLTLAKGVCRIVHLMGSVRCWLLGMRLIFFAFSTGA